MDEAIDWQAVALQYQLENEMYRHHMKLLTDVQDTVYKIPNAIETLWNKAMSHKMQLLIGLMLVYWFATVAFMLWDRFHVGRWFT